MKDKVKASSRQRLPRTLLYVGSLILCLVRPMMRLTLCAIVCIASLVGCDSDESLPTPPAEAQFISTVERYISLYKSASNELQKSSLRTQRAKELEGLVRDRNISGWVGTLREMTTTSGGDAAIVIQLPRSSIRVRTWNNTFSDVLGATLIKHGSSLYNQIAVLSKGNAVKFEGSFLIDVRDWVKEASVTENGSMTEPEFLFRFADVGRASP